MRSHRQLHIEGMRAVALSYGPRFLTWWSASGLNTTWSIDIQPEDFLALFERETAVGWQPRSMYATVFAGRRYFDTIWQSRQGQPDVQANWFDRTDTFAARAHDRRAQGYELTQIVPMVDAGVTYFHSLWRHQTEQMSWSLFDSSNSLSSTGERQRAAGFVPATIDVTIQNNEPYFHSLWRPRDRRDCSWSWNMDDASLGTYNGTEVAAGRRIVWLRTYAGDGLTPGTLWHRHLAIWCSDAPAAPVVGPATPSPSSAPSS